MLVLGIESSCDDTSVALLDSSDQGHFVITEKTASQIDIHKKYGGVVPEIAGRMHAEKIVPLIEEVLKGQKQPETIAVTAGPGLITGLIVGVEAARTMSFAKDIPLLHVNHIDGHMHSILVGRSGEEASIIFPALALIVSGGHTELILMKDHGDYQVLGKTKDDAAGECFDKAAKLLGLPYPGGPQISKLGESGDVSAIAFPRPMLDQDNYDFSFAGLKTSALYWLRDNKLSAAHLDGFNLPAGIIGKRKEPPSINDFCASFEQAIIDVLVLKTLKAAKNFAPKTIILAGGVAGNKKLRETLDKEINKNFQKTSFRVPELKYCMDNAAMIAVAGFFKAAKNGYTDWKKISADPNWEII